MASHWIVLTGRKRHKHNYEDVCRDALGQGVFYAHCLYTFLFAYSGSIAYLMIAGDSFADVGSYFGGTGVLNDRRFYVALSGTVISLPLSLFRDMVSSRNTEEV